jgi:hypothetical protein
MLGTPKALNSTNLNLLNEISSKQTKDNTMGNQQETKL